MNRLARIITVAVTFALIFALSAAVSSGAELVKYSSYKTGQVTAGPLNARSSASTTSSVRGELVKGQQVTIKGYKTNGSTKWYYITYNGIYHLYSGAEGYGYRRSFKRQSLCGDFRHFERNTQKRNFGNT